MAEVGFNRDSSGKRNVREKGQMEEGVMGQRTHHPFGTMSWSRENQNTNLACYHPEDHDESI